MIQVQNLAKYYGGKRALGPVSFEIADGECVGFLGLNGAGKTTALRVLACDLRPSAGTVRIGNIDALADPHQVRQRIGFLPETPPLYTDMTVRDYLTFAGKIRGMSAAAVESRLPEVEAVTHLGDVRDELIRTLSHGYRQRVGVAQAIVHKPKLLILDEPTRGLDPVQIIEMRNMIRALKSKHTVLVSSHVLTEVSETCDRLLVLGSGNIVGSGSEDELSSQVLEAKNVVVGVRPAGAMVTGEGDATAVSELLNKIEGVSSVKFAGVNDGALMLDVTGSEDVRARVNRALVEAGHDVIKLDRVERQLESIFLQIVRGGKDARN
jgi:ABC-2 type transport system ATP-binding protein